MEFSFKEAEVRARKLWNERNIYRVENKSDKPKFYVLDMFPYPSGAGLHVGHPLGYIASDIFARYKRLKGYNVLHPMGYDAFGLPAEQYAIETGQHPAVTTEKNVARYREQLDNIGFCFDWSREVRTADPNYYKWTQWIFLKLFNSWYDRAAGAARPIDTLIQHFSHNGTDGMHCHPGTSPFSPTEWHSFTDTRKREILMDYRLAYLAHADVWWCEALGTVLANDEVINGFSERGGHPVVKRQMKQWFLRITEYADRLLTALDGLDWSESMKDMQRNWIGKSTGAEVTFQTTEGAAIQVFTTRPDTLFGVDFLVVAPENELVATITHPAEKDKVDSYIQYVKSRSERERMSEVKVVTGCFTGAYAVHPLSGRHIPIWISEYVLAGYGTGAIMAVPSGDDRDHAFAKHFQLPITNIFGDKYTGKKAFSEKSGFALTHSDFLDGMDYTDALRAVTAKLETLGCGKTKVNYRLRDAGFSRQRYWGEPFPIVYIDGVPFGTDEVFINHADTKEDLPVALPQVEKYASGPDGQGPLANLTDWMHVKASVEGQQWQDAVRETNTMPGYAGSSWYFLRYADPNNNLEFAGADALKYWGAVDLYVGGNEHAVGHLLYSRMWTKVLFDLGLLHFDEPFRKLLNQGMIQGQSYFVPSVATATEDGIRFYLHSAEADTDVELQPSRLKNGHRFVDTKDRLTQAKYAEYLAEQGMYEDEVEDYLANAVWEPQTTEEGELYVQCKMEVEKMSKSKYNVVNPDDVVAEYGADTFRMYEMFLGPVEMSKPWDTKGIEGVYRFLKKMTRLYYHEDGTIAINDDAPTSAEWRILHQTIKKIGADIESFSFNTAVSRFMITVNELTECHCRKRAILEPLAILIAPFAPHLAECLWQDMGCAGSVTAAVFPVFEERYLVENSKKYPIAINGKPRAEMEFALDADEAWIKAEVLANETVAKWLDGTAPKKFIYVKGKMINVVV